MANAVNPNDLPKPDSTETNVDILKGYIFHFTLLGLPGIVYHAIERKLNPQQKERIVDGVIEKVLPTNKKK